MNHRPYFKHSIEALEHLCADANNSSNLQVLSDLAYELGFRKTDRARALAAKVAIRRGTRQSGDQPGEGVPPKPGKAHTPPPPRPSTGNPSMRKPTAEQSRAIEAFLQGGSLKINAFAGTGKTSTLQMLSHATAKQGQYIAFNRNIVADAREKFPKSVNCSTTHSLAFQATPSQYKRTPEKMVGRVNAHKLAELLDLRSNWRIDKDHTLKPVSQGSIILGTLRRFTYSADPEPLGVHVPRHGALLAASPGTLKTVEEFALRGARHVWGRMQDPDDMLPLGHDGYLKLWALGDPSIGADFILLDEAQDTNPVILDVLRKQDSQIVYVGDRYQQIYDWRGAVNAMEDIATDATTLLTKSFRFGHPIAAAASKVLLRLEEKVSVTGNGEVESKIGPTNPDTILARTNALTVTAVIEALDEGRKPHLVGGTGELMDMLRGVEHLKCGQPSTVADFFGFENWVQVVEFAKSGEGEHLLTFVNLVESRGEKQLMWALNRTVDEERSNLVISTAHKAKGREWSKVRLMDDFLKIRPGAKTDSATPQQHDPSELRLFYVAMTRARRELELPERLMAVLGLSSPNEARERETPTDRMKQKPRAEASWSPPENWSPKPPPQPPAAASQVTPRRKGLFRWLFGD